MGIRIVDYRPPEIAQLLLLCAAILHWATPLCQLHIFSNHVLGVILGISGFGLMMRGWWLFKKFDTASCPTAITDRLVTAGVYRFTRNPMYLGVIAMFLAVAIFVGAALGYSRERMLSDYHIAEGGFMALGLLFMLFAPALAAKARGFGQHPIVPHVKGHLS